MGDLYNTMCAECGRHHPYLEDCRDYVMFPVDPEFNPKTKVQSAMRNITIHLIDNKGEEIAVWSLPRGPVPGMLPNVVTWAGTGRFFALMPSQSAVPVGTPASDLEPRYRECAAPVTIGVL